MPGSSFDSSNRLTGKTASAAFNQGNNAGMIFKKEAKAATSAQDYKKALVKLRVAETGPKGSGLRQWADQR